MSRSKRNILMDCSHLRSDSIGGERFEKGLKVDLGGTQARDLELAVYKLF